MNNSATQINQFDQVQLLTTKSVSYLSAPPGTDLSPHGVWSVVGIMEAELLLAKNNIIIKIPASDVLVIADYDLRQLNQVLGNLSHGKAKEDDTNSQE